MEEYITHSRDETVALGRRLAAELAPGSLIAFTGGLGAGKTAFCQGIAEGLGCTDPVSSPTFAIVNYYRGPRPFAHFDLYRIHTEVDLSAAGFYDYLDMGAVVAAEWSENCADLLPEHFRFVRGVVDTQDLSLNISREMLQKDNQLKLIHNALEKKIKNELHAMLVNDREKYETFWKAFCRQNKFGIYGDYGMHKDLLSDLLMFYSAKEQKLITLDEYIEKMPEGQKAIYFAAGDEAARLGKLPNAQLVLSKGYDLLLCSEDVDEFCLQIMHDYKEKEFKNINSGDLGLETEDEKKAAEETATENKDLFEEIKKALNGKIKDVKVNPTLQDHPVSLSSEGGISMEMEKILRKMPAGGEGMESTKVLELNPNHAVFGALKAAHEAGDTDKINKYAELLYDQALLIEGLPLEDPVAYAQLVCDLMK